MSEGKFLDTAVQMKPVINVYLSFFTDNDISIINELQHANKSIIDNLLKRVFIDNSAMILSTTFGVLVRLASTRRF